MKLLISIILMAVLAPSLVVGQDCVDYEEYLHRMGWVQVTKVHDMAISGDYAYLSNRYYDIFPGLQIIDFSDPQSPQIIGEMEISGGTIAITGNTLYMTGGPGLQVIDVTNPVEPVMIGILDIPNQYFRDIAISGEFAYVIGADSGLLVIDISNPENPEIVGNVATEYDFWHVAVSGEFAYVSANGLNDLNVFYVIDISNPQTPQIMNSLETSGSCSALAISGSFVYFLCDQEGLDVIDISDPPLAHIVGSIEIQEGFDVSASGGYAYVASKYAGLQVIDATTPQSPRIAETLGIGCYYGCNRVAISGSKVFVAEVPSYESIASHFHVIDIAVPWSPPLVGQCEISGSTLDIAISGDYSYLAASDLQVVDISDPQDPQVVGNVETPGIAETVAVSGNLACVANIADDFSGSLSVVDVSNPTSPHILGSIVTPEGIQDVAVSGDLALIITDNKLTAINISNPTNPQVEGDLDLALGQSTVLTISGSYAYLVFGSWGGKLIVVDIADPQNLQVAGTVASLVGHTSSIIVEGGLAYVVCAVPGLTVFDITSPEDPVIAGYDYLVPQENWSYLTSGGGGIADGFAFVLDRNQSLNLVDISDPWNPSFLLGSPIPDGAQCATVSGSFVFVGTETGLTILPTHCTGTTGIDGNQNDPEPSDTPMPMAHLSVYPNPFNPQTTVSFVVERSGAVELCVYDLTGKLIAVLADRVFEPGEYSVAWQGKNLQGRAVASGTYVLQLSTEQRVRSQKMMLIR